MSARLHPTSAQSFSYQRSPSLSSWASPQSPGRAKGPGQSGVERMTLAARYACGCGFTKPPELVPVQVLLDDDSDGDDGTPVSHQQNASDPSELLDGFLPPTGHMSPSLLECLCTVLPQRHSITLRESILPQYQPLHLLVNPLFFATLTEIRRNARDTTHEGHQNGFQRTEPCRTGLRPL